MQRCVYSLGLSAILLLAATTNVLAQGTTIAYQGRLNDGGAPANTNYDFRFAVFNDLTATNNASRASIWVTNFAVPVSNGLFAVTLDFGSGVFNGTANGSNDWLDVSVRAAGATNFTGLSPRQPILPAPYALFAVTASNLLGSITATQITGTISSSLISGSYSNAVNFVNSTNTFAGTFTGNGAGLTSLNGSAVASGTVADARLSSNVALLNQNQTFSGVNLFNNSNSFTGPGTYTGVNTFTNWNNTFVGNFYGNGLVGWGGVTGTSQQAVRDHGYMETNPLYTTITLPVSPLTNGDIVRVSGGGTGGWRVVCNSGQSIVGTLASYGNCFPVPMPVSSGDTGVAASADGVHMFAVGTGFQGIYYSANSGISWGQLSAPTITGNYYYSIACSANGKIVYAEPNSSSSYIQASTNGGTTWTATPTNAVAGQAIACTADGSKLYLNSIASSGNGFYTAQLYNGVVYIYTNYASGSFTVSTPGSGSNTCLAVSSDCTRMLVGCSPGLLYASADQGGHWTTLTSTNQTWSGAWMSPDGTRFAAAASGSVGGVFSAVAVVQSTTTTNGISGSQGSAVELQYLGNGQFMPVSSSGVIWAN